MRCQQAKFRNRSQEGKATRMKCFVTGGAGFVGCNVVDRLLDDGHEVVCFDDFSTGQKRFLESAETRRGFHLVRGDILDADALQKDQKDATRFSTSPPTPRSASDRNTQGRTSSRTRRERSMS